MTTFEKEFNGANIMTVEVAGTGMCGGDAGHGGYAHLRMEDLGGTAWQIAITTRDQETQTIDDPQSIVFTVQGDSETAMLQEIMEWAAVRLAIINSKTGDRK